MPNRNISRYMARIGKKGGAVKVYETEADRLKARRAAQRRYNEKRTCVECGKRQAALEDLSTDRLCEECNNDD